MSDSGDVVLSEHSGKLTVPYMDRVFPWGESGREMESRLKKAGLRERWYQRTCEHRKLDRAIDWNEARWRAGVEFPPGVEVDESGWLSEDDQKFLEKCKEGLNLVLPQRAGVDKEIDWVGSNLKRALPDVQKAPSYWSINFIMEARVNQRVSDTFWATCWSKRLSPGDGKGKKQQSSVTEDQVDEAAESHEDHLRRLLGG